MKPSILARASLLLLSGLAVSADNAPYLAKIEGAKQLFNGNAKTYVNVGLGMGEAMVKLLK